MKHQPALLILLALTSTPTASAIAADSTPAAKPETVAQALPPRVDLRPIMKQWGMSPRNQGRRNTCSVFATTAAFEFAYSKHIGHDIPLSEEYLNWACNQIIHNETQDRGQFFRNLIDGFYRYGICTNEEMPYTEHFEPELKPSDKATGTAQNIRTLDFHVHWIRPFQKDSGLSDREMREIKQVLASGYPVAAGAAHSRLLVGYTDDATQPGGGVFLVRDSNGGRYVKVTYEFLKTNINDVFWIEAPSTTKTPS